MSPLGHGPAPFFLSFYFFSFARLTISSVLFSPFLHPFSFGLIVTIEFSFNLRNLFYFFFLVFLGSQEEDNKREKDLAPTLDLVYSLSYFESDLNCGI